MLNFGTMSLLNRLLPSLVKCNTPVINIQPVRWASKKAGGSTKSRQHSGRAHHYGWKVQDGQLVTSGSILVKQRHLRFHPGENVRIGRKGDLLALEHGTVAVTCQPFTPDPSSHCWVQKEYGDRGTSRTIYKKYFHVLTREQPGRFKMVGEV